MHISTFRTPFRHLPKLNGREVDLYMLYTLCTEQGGWIKVPIINFIFHQSTTLTTFDTARILTLIAIIIKYATAQNGSQQFIKFNMMHFYAYIYCCVLFVYASAHTFARRWCVSRARAARETGGPCAPQVCACMRKVRSYMCVCVCRARKVMVKSLSVRRPNLPPPRLDTTHV